MKTRAKRLLCLCLALLLVLGLTACGGSGTTGGKKAELLSMDARPDAPSEIPEGLDIDWNYRYTNWRGSWPGWPRRIRTLPTCTPSAPRGRSAISGAWS